MNAARSTRSSTDGLRRDPATLLAGSLWGASGLAVVVSIALLALRISLPGQPWVSSASFVALCLGALALFAMVVVTLPRDVAYDADADLSALPPVLSWPLRVGTWAGIGVLAIAGILLLFSSDTAAGAGNAWPARLCISILALIGALATLFTAQPVSWVLSLAAVWCAIVVIALARGLYGLVRRWGRRRA